MLLQNWQRATISRTSVPRCRLFTVEQESSLGASLYPTSISIRRRPAFSHTPAAPQCILARPLSKDLSGLQKVSQLNFAFCSSFSLPSTALHQRNFVGLLSSFSEAFVGWSSGKDFTIRELLGSQPPLLLRPNSGPGSDSSVKGPNTPRKPLRKF